MRGYLHPCFSKMRSYTCIIYRTVITCQGAEPKYVSFQVGFGQVMAS